MLPFENNAEITVSCAVKKAAAIIYGPSATVLITVLGTLGAEIGLHRDWHKSAFKRLWT